MKTIVDYVDNFNLTFDQVAINEVDFAVFSNFSMNKIENVMNFELPKRDNPTSLLLSFVNNSNPFKREITIKDLYKSEYFDKLVTKDQNPKDLDILKKMACNPRFRDLVIRYQVAEHDESKVKQFSALTFIYQDKFAVIAYRGTDHSVIGWKEDFNLSFLNAVPSQISAAQYLNNVASYLPKKLYLCGHSKGGNLALYAGMKCDEAIFNRIVKISSFDGPGFNESYKEDQDYLKIVPKTTKYIPQTSIIGLLMNTLEPIKVVYSSENLILQHELHSWEVINNHFKTLPSVDDFAKLSDAAIDDWFKEMSYSQKQEFVEVFFGVILEAGVKDFDNIKNIPATFKKFNKLLAKKDKETRDFLNSRLWALIANHFKNIKFGK